MNNRVRSSLLARGFIIAWAMLAISASPAAAQSGVRGVVFSTWGTVVDGAVVRFEPVDGRPPLVATSTDRGFVQPSVVWGTYKVTASSAGFESATRTITIDNDSFISFSLEPLQSLPPTVPPRQASDAARAPAPAARFHSARLPAFEPLEYPNGRLMAAVYEGRFDGLETRSDFRNLFVVFATQYTLDCRQSLPMPPTTFRGHTSVTRYETRYEIVIPGRPALPTTVPVEEIDVPWTVDVDTRFAERYDAYSPSHRRPQKIVSTVSGTEIKYWDQEIRLLIERNTCEGPVMVRFVENLLRCAHGRAPLPPLPSVANSTELRDACERYRAAQPPAGDVPRIQSCACVVEKLPTRLSGAIREILEREFSFEALALAAVSTAGTIERLASCFEARP
jgi:hypothetical protein